MRWPLDPNAIHKVASNNMLALTGFVFWFEAVPTQTEGQKVVRRTTAGSPLTALLTHLRVIDDWTTLTGLQVEIADRSGVRDWGAVEAVTSDGEILWLKQEGVVTRRLVEKTPATYVVLSTPQASPFV